MRHRQRQVGRPSIPCYQKRVNDWCKRLDAISKEIQAEHDAISGNPPAETSSTVLFAEDLTTARQFLERAEERLLEYVEMRMRHAVWEEAKARGKR